MSHVMESNIIFVRYSDLENGVCFRYPALLISHHLALVVFDNGLELDIVKPAADLGAYELVYCSNPIFQVGEDWKTVLLEASQMTILQFAEKYLHPELHDYLQHEAPPSLLLAFEERLP